MRSLILLLSEETLGNMIDFRYNELREEVNIYDTVTKIMDN